VPYIKDTKGSPTGLIGLHALISTTPLYFEDCTFSLEKALEKISNTILKISRNNVKWSLLSNAGNEIKEGEEKEKDEEREFLVEQAESKVRMVWKAANESLGHSGGGGRGRGRGRGGRGGRGRRGGGRGGGNAGEKRKHEGGGGGGDAKKAKVES
jgi:lupus La protein